MKLFKYYLFLPAFAWLHIFAVFKSFFIIFHFKNIENESLFRILELYKKSFILDVSSSMNAAGKLDLLKQSMLELVDVLRPNDLISVITYSSTVSVIVSEKTGDDKDFIIDKVNSKSNNYNSHNNWVFFGKYFYSILKVF